VVGQHFQGLANGIYRQTARATARILGTSEIVERIFVHRSVATGEVTFGRSDIDMAMVVRQPVSESCDAVELWSLYRKVRLLRLCNPALGHIEVHDPFGLQNWLRTDTYRGSMERRSALFVYGEPIEMPPLPVRTEDAVRRFALFPYYFLPAAIRQRNRRNLGKVALEMWNAYATAIGITSEPFLTRRETEAACRAREDAAAAVNLGQDPEQALGFAFRLAQRLHDRLLPPLEKISRPTVFSARLPPSFRERVFVVLTGPGSLLPDEVFRPYSLVLTPELLHLTVHYANAFLHWVVPPELTELGLLPPTVEEFVRTCQFFSNSHVLRNPGFVSNNTRVPVGAVSTVHHAIKYLERGQIPPPMNQEEVDRVLAVSASFADYYKCVFPRLYKEREELWDAVQRLPDSTT
jgi:hypothetical protein